MNFKSAVLQLHERAIELAQAAELLPNKNLADVIKHSAAKLKQASEHADIDAVDAAAEAHMAALHPDDKPAAPPPFDPNKAAQ